MSEELLPCPFCGGEMGADDIEEREPGHAVPGFDVSCECGAAMYAYDRNSAIRDWNRRSSAIDPSDDSMRRALGAIVMVYRSSQGIVNYAESVLNGTAQANSRPEAAGEGSDG